mgnify:CR=1 FL=1
MTNLPTIDCRHLARSVNGCRTCRAGAHPKPSRLTCSICKWREPNRRGLGDVVETVVRVATLGRMKPKRGRVPTSTSTGSGKGCGGCRRRRAALNRGRS